MVRIYHMPWNASYDATNPEECLATAAGAVRAGSRRAGLTPCLGAREPLRVGRGLPPFPGYRSQRATPAWPRVEAIAITIGA